MRYKRLFSVCLCIGIAALTLTGCSLVQWLPSSSCEHVRYERTGDYVEVDAQCRV